MDENQELNQPEQDVNNDSGDDVIFTNTEDAKAEDLQKDRATAKAAPVPEKSSEKPIEEAKTITEPSEDYNAETIIRYVGTNPYTGEKIEDIEDVKEYIAMKTISDSGGDPINDYGKFIKDKGREEAKKSAQDEWYRKDAQDFSTKHSDVDINALIADQKFARFCGDRVGKVPLSTLYEDYQFVTGGAKADTKADTKEAVDANKLAAQIVANKNASPGATATGNGTGVKDFFTSEEVDRMTPEEVHKNYDAIRASMAKW